MFSTYADRVPAEADLVCYWFEKAGRQIASGKAKRVELVATNSIRGHANQRALQVATEGRRIFEAWSDEPWVVEGAAVRVSLVCFSGTDDTSVAGTRLNGEPVESRSNLPGHGPGATTAARSSMRCAAAMPVTAGATGSV